MQCSPADKVAYSGEFIIGRDDLDIDNGSERLHWIACGAASSQPGISQSPLFREALKQRKRASKISSKLANEGARIKVVKGNLQSPQDCLSAADGRQGGDSTSLRAAAKNRIRCLHQLRGHDAELAGCKRQPRIV